MVDFKHTDIDFALNQVPDKATRDLMRYILGEFFVEFGEGTSTTTRTLINTSSAAARVIEEDDSIVVGTLAANATFTVGKNTTHFSVRDAASNIGTYTVTLDFGGGDTLVLDTAKDYVEVTKVDGTTWNAYNYRTQTAANI